MLPVYICEDDYEILCIQKEYIEKQILINGYDMKIVASEYRIPTDADMETIAKIITKQDR